MGAALHRNLLGVEDILINPLIAVRDIHFVSSVIVAGIVFFDLFVARRPCERGLATRGGRGHVQNPHRQILWISLVLSILFRLCMALLLSAGLPASR